MENAVIHGYTLKYKLGSGGMADVWYAENSLQKPVAVKILQKRFCDDAAIVSRFENEAKLMVQLNHPNIRNIYDYTTIDGCPCMLMEYLEGKDLSQRMKQGEQFTQTQLKTWWNQLADALQYTHRKQIVHRDIKPSNLFLTEDGRIKLLDFGVAKLKDSITLTQTGSSMGTPMYMSAEQVYNAKNLNYKTDAYSLAVTFYHLLTGRPPYDTGVLSDFEVQEKIVREPLDTAALAEPWNTFLSAFLQKDPLQRSELRAVEAAPVAGLEETMVQNTIEIKPQPAPQPAAAAPPVYFEKRKSPWPYILITLACLGGLIYFFTNTALLDNVWDKLFGKDDTPPEVVVNTPPPVKKPVQKKTKKDTVIAVTPVDTMPVINVPAETPPQKMADTGEKENAIRGLVKSYYVSRANCDGLSRYFYPVIKQYLSKTNFRLDEAEQDCRNYHSKWKYIAADIDNNSYVFTHQDDGNTIVDYSLLYKIKQQETDDWINYNIDVSMVVDNQNKITRIVERRIEKL